MIWCGRIGRAMRRAVAHWLTRNRGITADPDADLAAAALARGVKVQPLSWHRQHPGAPGLLLGYAASPPAVLSEGVAALGEVYRRSCR